MKNWFLFSGIFFLLLSLDALAQKPMSQEHMGSSTTMHQVMSREHAQEMTQLMTRMHTMLQDMSQMMDRDQIRQQDRRKDMAKLMRDLSGTLGNMAQHIEQGTLTAQNREQLEKQVQNLNKEMKRIQQQAGLSN